MHRILYILLLFATAMTSSLAQPAPMQTLTWDMTCLQLDKHTAHFRFDHPTVICDFHIYPNTPVSKLKEKLPTLLQQKEAEGLLKYYGKATGLPQDWTTLKYEDMGSAVIMLILNGGSSSITLTLQMKAPCDWQAFEDIILANYNIFATSVETYLNNNPI